MVWVIGPAEIKVRFACHAREEFNRIPAEEFDKIFKQPVVIRLSSDCVSPRFPESSLAPSFTAVASASMQTIPLRPVLIIAVLPILREFDLILIRDAKRFALESISMDGVDALAPEVELTDKVPFDTFIAAWVI